MSDETYIENKREYYTANDYPVWSGRNREHPGADGKRADRLADEPLVKILLNQMDRGETLSRPSLGSDAAKSKDLDAFSALEQGAWLVGFAAKWAINHQIGLAINNLEFVPLLPNATKQLPEYQAAKATVDSHDHEMVGGAFTVGPDTDPILARRIAINLLTPLCSHLGIPPALVEALKALESGEVMPILQPVSTTDKVRYTESRFQLQAVALVEYWTVRKGKKHKAMAMVAEAFGVPLDTLRGWESRLRTKLGAVEVSAAISRARNQAKSFENEETKKHRGERHANPEDFDCSFGPASADAIGKRYRAFLKSA